LGQESVEELAQEESVRSLLHRRLVPERWPPKAQALMQRRWEWPPDVTAGRDDQRLVEQRDAQADRCHQHLSGEGVLGEQHLRDGCRQEEASWYRCDRRRSRSPRAEEAQSGEQDRGSQARDRLQQQRHRVQDEKCDQPVTTAKCRHRHG